MQIFLNGVAIHSLPSNINFGVVVACTYASLLSSFFLSVAGCEQELEKARSAAGSCGFGELVSSNPGKAAASKHKRTKGASLVNPSSKRYVCPSAHG